MSHPDTPYINRGSVGASIDVPKSENSSVEFVAHKTLIEVIERELALAALPPLGWYDVLLAIEHAAERKLRMHELSDAIVLSRSNLTRLVDRMAAAGLLAREACPTDRRGAYAVLTDDGLAMRRRMWPVYVRCIDQFFARHLSATEAKVFAEALERAIDGARDVAPTLVKADRP